MSDADTSKGPEAIRPAIVQKAQAGRGQITEIEETLNSLLQNAKSFPVRYQLSQELLSSSSGRLTLSVVRARFEKDWDVKEITAKLAEDMSRSAYWIIMPKKPLATVEFKKDEDDDDLSLSDIMAPLKF